MQVDVDDQKRMNIINQIVFKKSIGLQETTEATCTQDQFWNAKATALECKQQTIRVCSELFKNEKSTLYLHLD